MPHRSAHPRGEPERQSGEENRAAHFCDDDKTLPNQRHAVKDYFPNTRAHGPKLLNERHRGARVGRVAKCVGLFEAMRDFEAYRFIALANVLGTLTSLHPDHDAVIGDEWKATNVPALQAYAPVLYDLGMDASLASLERLIALLQLENVRFSALVNTSTELQGRLFDQAHARLFFGLSVLETDFARFPSRGWEIALERFPDINPDVLEAAYCFSLSRYPACVYHTVQITECGLVELGRFLKVTDPHSGWTAVANALEKVLNKKHPERSAFEKKHFASLEQIQGTVQALKNAWRNKISHHQGRLILLRTDFGSERVEEIFFATRAFMRRLAEDLPPQKLKKKTLADISDLDAVAATESEL